MPNYKILTPAYAELDAIYDYTRDKWGIDQAEKYTGQMFDRFQDISDRHIPWRAIPSEFGVSGYYLRHEKHYMYWRARQDGGVSIVTILHTSMLQSDRLKSAFAVPDNEDPGE